MKTILFNPTTQDCLATGTVPGSKRYESLIAEGYVVVGTAHGFNIKVTKYEPIHK